MAKKKAQADVLVSTRSADSDGDAAGFFHVGIIVRQTGPVVMVTERRRGVEKKESGRAS